MLKKSNHNIERYFKVEIENKKYDFPTKQLKNKPKFI